VIRAFQAGRVINRPVVTVGDRQRHAAACITANAHSFGYSRSLAHHAKAWLTARQSVASASHARFRLLTPALECANQKDHDRRDQEYVDQAANRVRRHESEEPQDEQDHSDGKHRLSLRQR
jgi:hypothetical protein